MKVTGINQCAAQTGEKIYNFVLLNSQTLGTVSSAWPRPAETCPPWGTVGTGACSEAAC